jgi:hypothetical protein
MDQISVYDLGEVDKGDRPDRPQADPQRRTAPRPAWSSAAPAQTTAGDRFDLSGSLSFFLPGSGQLVRGEWAHGLFFLASIGFLFTLGWAVVGTMDRLTETVVLLGHPRGVGLWILGSIYAAAAGLHLINVLTRDAGASGSGATHGVVAGCASAVMPGWGQVLNGHPRRAALFLGGLWLIGASWLLVSQPAQELYVALDVHLPRALELFSSAPVRWTLPAVVWALAIYDASVGGRR